jgi:uncharacterized phage protein (TIGR02220 family)
LSHFNEAEVEGCGFKMAFLIAKTSTMAKDKNSFLIYCDIIHTVDKLDDFQAGKLFKHLLKYVNDLNPVADDIVTEIAFEPIKQSLKRDLQKYESIRERNSENAKKRWNATASDRIPKEPKRTKIADSVSDSVSDSDIYNIDYQALLDFVNKTFGRNFQVINDKIKRSYKARLKDGYKKEDIIQAIKNCKENAYHKENNYQYCTPEFFSRAETLDKYAHRTIVTESDSILNHLKNN